VSIFKLTNDDVINQQLSLVEYRQYITNHRSHTNVCFTSTNVQNCTVSAFHASTK